MGDRPPPEAPPRGGAAVFVAVAALLGLAAAMLFVGFPAIDLAVSGLFHQGGRTWLLREPGFGPLVRRAFDLSFWAVSLAALAGLAAVVLRGRRIWAFGFPHFLFVVLCVLVGPGLLANAILKNNWGRARPFHVQEFGGDQVFTPALMLSDQCVTNCSFVAGEASSIFVVGFALALLLAGRRRGQALAAACLVGGLAGVARIGAGGHFLSDVVFAGVFMALVARGLYWALFEAGERTFAQEGPVHRRLAAGAAASGAAISSLARRLGRGRGRERERDET